LPNQAKVSFFSPRKLSLCRVRLAIRIGSDAASVHGQAWHDV
jgi:hypothetical protein